MICRNCGAQIPDGVWVCGVCGARVEQSGTYGQMPPDAVYCRTCGSPVAQGSGVCATCGTPVMPGAYQQGRNKSNISIAAVIAAIMIAAAVVAGGILLGMSIIGGSDKDDSNNSAATETTTEVQTEAPAPTQAPQQPAANTGYLFNSDTEYITEAYLNTKTRDEVRLILNEIYARHGYVFNNEYYRQYFSAKPWYTPMYSSAETAEWYFNSIETANKNISVQYEKARGWR